MIREAIIKHGEARTGEGADWARDVSALGWRAFRYLAGFYRLAGFRRYAPAPLLHLARLGAVQAEDCGPCVRTTARFAKAGGLSAVSLRAALAGGAALAGDEAAAFRFGRAIAGGDAAGAAAEGEAIEVRFGRKIRTELALGAATVRFYPAMKRGMGMAASCAITRFDDL